MTDDRTWLKLIAAAMDEQSCAAHVKGIELCRQSARIEQLARITSDAEAKRMLELLVQSGVIRPKDDGYVLCSVTTDGGTRKDSGVAN